MNKFKEAVGDAKVGHALGNALSVAPMERLLRNVVVAANLCRPEQQPPDFWGKISSKVPRFDCEKFLLVSRQCSQFITCWNSASCSGLALVLCFPPLQVSLRRTS